MSILVFFFFSSRRRHTRSKRDWSSDVCSSDLTRSGPEPKESAGTPRLAKEKWSERKKLPASGRESGVKLRPWSLATSIRSSCRVRPASPEVERSEEHTSELQSRFDLVCRLLLE